MSVQRLRYVLLLSPALLAAPMTAGHANAHALGAECKVNGSKVELEAYYDDDAPARNARVRVEDGASKVLAEGRTDDMGRWSFLRPSAGEYRVLVDAGAGHRTQLKLSIPTGSLPSTATASVSANDDCDCCTDPSNPPAASSRISDGASREEFTAWPWLKIGIGVAVIGGLGVAFVIFRKIS